MAYYTPLILPAALVRAQQEFSLALWQQVAQAQPQRNVFLSPFSVVAALMLVLEGSAGATRQALASTLRVADLPAEQLTAAVARQLAAFTKLGAEQPTLHVANGLWVDRRFALDPTYAARVREHYQAEATALDFAAPDTVAAINAWISQHTQGRIAEVLPAGSLSPEAPLVLANAVYFRGDWASKFEASATKPGLFALANGRQVQVPLMHLRSRQLGYLRGPGYQLVLLPYQGHPRSASMLLLVPDLPTGLPALLAGLSAASWQGWLRDLHAHHEPLEVALTMPRFRLEWGQDLLPALRALGLAVALEDGADFTPLGFAPGTPGFVGQVAHKTYLSVDEEGTEAAGATVVWMVGGAPDRSQPRRVAVRADRPFGCTILDNETATILFAGAVYRPE